MLVRENVERDERVMFVDIDSAFMSAISDIRHRHLLFRYRNKICRTKSSHSDIGRVPISKESRYRKSPDIDISFHSDIGLNQYRIFRYLKLINHSQLTRDKFCHCWYCFSGFEPTFFISVTRHHTTALRGFTKVDVGYRISNKSLFRYPI
jgi:hypothetical protein